MTEISNNVTVVGTKPNLKYQDLVDARKNKRNNIIPLKSTRTDDKHIDENKSNLIIKDTIGYEASNTNLSKNSENGLHSLDESVGHLNPNSIFKKPSITILTGFGVIFSLGCAVALGGSSDETNLSNIDPLETIVQKSEKKPTKNINTGTLNIPKLTTDSYKITENTGVINIGSPINNTYGSNSTDTTSTVPSTKTGGVENMIISSEIGKDAPLIDVLKDSKYKICDNTNFEILKDDTIITPFGNKKLEDDLSSMYDEIDNGAGRVCILTEEWKSSYLGFASDLYKKGLVGKTEYASLVSGIKLLSEQL
ncbi:MAG: hypothetical protein HRU03_01225 [Nanoarchaeales archaeon]|nr:hypothetical protein [Nanoarchaeales archaeon]